MPQDIPVEAEAGMPAYDDMGCLTYAGAREICGFGSDDVVCAEVAACGLGPESECSINCEMAATVFCISREMVEPCETVARGRDCPGVTSSCRGWLHF